MVIVFLRTFQLEQLQHRESEIISWYHFEQNDQTSYTAKPLRCTRIVFIYFLLIFGEFTKRSNALSQYVRRILLDRKRVVNSS